MAAACGALMVPGAAPASAGGALAVSPGGGGGGTEYGSAVSSRSRPVATRFRVTPTRVVAGGVLPRVLLRVDEAGVPEVRARVVIWPAKGRGQIVRHDLGTIVTGTVLRPAWPKGLRLAAGRYVVRVHATDPAGRSLVRRPSALGRTTLTVVAKPKPKPTPAPAPAPAPALTPVDPGRPSSGVFPVAGAHTYGDGMGAARGDRLHEGVDVLGAAGTPVVAPVPGRILWAKYQAGGAGEYIVLRADDGRDMFFAHCRRDSTVVAQGSGVTAGQALCAMGSTGSSTTNHLHFEIWPNGWRTGKDDSVAVDPMAQLLAWDR